tara:strand:+ start:3547 stop:4404 length:858 start_codon:yes stop_codon:yes gene_type:complete
MIPLAAGGIARGAAGALGGGRAHSGSVAFKMSATAQLDRGSLEKFRRQFGDTSDQALLRVAVSTSKQCARLTNPRGRKKEVKDKILNAINKGALLNITPLPAKEFNRHAKSSNPAQFANGRWYKMNQDQILRSEEEVWDFIEKSRRGSKRGRPKWLHPSRKAICKNKDMGSVLKRRRKLAGIMKGSWLGAFAPLSRKIKGSDKPRIAKNYMSWAQKHMDMGKARWLPGARDKSEARLISKAPGTLDKRYFDQSLADEAVKIGWANTIKWYKLQCKLKFQDKGART